MDDTCWSGYLHVDLAFCGRSTNVLANTDLVILLIQY